MNNQAITLKATLMDLQAELSQLQLWEAQRPTEDALLSTEPFCIDTLTFPQWLQFIFIEKMLHMIDNHLPLPGQCGIAPMAEEYFKGLTLHSQNVINTLSKIDDILSQP